MNCQLPSIQADGTIVKLISLLSVLALNTAFAIAPTWGAEVETNSIRMHGAPTWLTQSRVERVTDKIEAALEWPIKRVTVVWHFNAQEFQAVHGFGPTVLAVAKGPENIVHLGPLVTQKNFDATFGHELVHVILYQKYKAAIPKWLEEGMASYISGERRVNYKWLASQPKIEVTKLTHPFKGAFESQHHYQLSTAVMEMIASRCPLQDLLQLSVGKSLTTYLETFCEIKDINAAFNEYLKKKAK